MSDKSEKMENPMGSNPENASVSINECGDAYVPKAKFRLQNQRILLTYKFHLDKNMLKSVLNEVCHGMKQIEMAHEVGNSKGVDYNHSHVLIDFGSNFQTSNSRLFDVYVPINDSNKDMVLKCWYDIGQVQIHTQQLPINVHPNIRKIKTKKHWEACLKYLAKEDPENAHLKIETVNMVTDIIQSDTMMEAVMKHVKKPSDFLGVKMIYESCKRTDRPEPNKPHWWTWQVHLDTELENEPDPRKIIWYVDPPGGAQKSEFVKWMRWKDPSKFYVVTQFSGSSNAATIMDSAIESGWKSHCLFIDFPRDFVDNSVYAPLEMIKNGDITSTKYKGRTVEFEKKPHVVVFSNWWPDIRKFSYATGKIEVRYITYGNFHGVDDYIDTVVGPEFVITNFVQDEMNRKREKHRNESLLTQTVTSDVVPGKML